MPVALYERTTTYCIGNTTKSNIDLNGSNFKTQKIHFIDIAKLISSILLNTQHVMEYLFSRFFL